MESFGSTKAIRAADVERIAEVAGISEELAVEVKNNA
jgi:excinuclease UvrABC nuclease subunit